MHLKRVSIFLSLTQKQCHSLPELGPPEASADFQGPPGKGESHPWLRSPAMDSLSCDNSQGSVLSLGFEMNPHVEGRIP